MECKFYIQNLHGRWSHGQGGGTPWRWTSRYSSPVKDEENLLDGVDYWMLDSRPGKHGEKDVE